MKPAYYNEHNKFAAAWLRNLIAAGHIANGDVDERSIEDIAPYELNAYGQCHFFAGIGVWSYALRRAGWSDNESVWTGSCPCQPFSAAVQGIGFADERHLWPAWFHLISECRPARVYGEQVASAAAAAWIDLVHADVESVGYAFGCVPFPSAGVGAPHIRDRAYWMADATGTRLQMRGALHGQYDRQGLNEISVVAGAHQSRAGDAYWADADWCSGVDGLYRPVEPGTFPLVDGPAARVGRLRGYGNAVNAVAAQLFIEATL